MSGYGFLRQPRWLAFGFLVLLVIPAFVLLSRWQLHRLDERRAFNEQVTEHAAAAPVPLDSVLDPGDPVDSVPQELRWLPVTVSGTYDAAGQVLVRKRPLDGRNGFWVATPLVTSSGAVVVVNRGWIEAAGGATDTPAVPAPPAGVVDVVGRIQPSQDAPVPQPADLPEGQITDLSVPLVVDEGVAAYPAYLDLVESDPAQAPGLTPIPLPDLGDGPHLSYAVQWIFFAGVAVVGFVLIVRRERQYGEEQEAAAVPPADPPS